MKNSFDVLLCIGGVLIIGVGIGLGYGSHIECEKWQKKTVELGYAEYNNQTSEWQWRVKLE